MSLISSCDEILLQINSLMDKMSNNELLFSNMNAIASVSRMSKNDGLSILDVVRCFENHSFFENSLFNLVADMLVRTLTEVDIRVSKKFMPVFQLVLLNVKDCAEAMSYIFSHPYFLKQPANLPELKNHFPNFSIDVQDILDGLSSEQLLSTMKNDEFKNTFLFRSTAFYLTVVPKPTLRHLILHSFGRPKFQYKIIAQLLYLLPPILKKTVVYYFNEPYSELLITAFFRRLIRSDLDSQYIKSEFRAGIEYFVMQLSGFLKEQFDSDDSLLKSFIDVSTKIITTPPEPIQVAVIEYPVTEMKDSPPDISNSIVSGKNYNKNGDETTASDKNDSINADNSSCVVKNESIEISCEEVT